jgi:hypothetical protein
LQIPKHCAEQTGASRAVGECRCWTKPIQHRREERIDFPQTLLR